MSTIAPASTMTPRSLIAGRYLPLAELGRGGMGSVYRVNDTTSGRELALKTLDKDDTRIVRFFEREYHTLATLKHPRVIEVYEFGIAEDGRRFYTMELLTGSDLASLGTPPVRDVCTYLRDVATSLLLLHARKLVHRDVSPRNIRLDHAGRAKLLDFGALCAFGTARELVGTPQCIAPETIRHEPLDQRTDLFALGVVGYWALTGEAPFAARRLRDVEAALRCAPKPPSALRADVPKALDQLILAMLAIDPAERPASAAEVVERLSAIAGLDDAPLEGSADAHLQSPELVGREREKRQLAQHLQRAATGLGGVVVIEGAPGMGTSRLLEEVALDARILGVRPLRVDAKLQRGQQAVLLGLAQALLRAAPAEARETLPAHADVLACASDELAALLALDAPPKDVLPRQPAERRARIQNALAEWICDVAERCPLLVAVHDMQLVDSASSGALVVLAHLAARRRLLLVLTQPLDDTQSHGLQQLARMGARIKLRGLELAAMERLVASVFGEVPHRARLTRWLQRVTLGNPGQAFELLRDLVERGVVRYEGGAFALPAHLSELALPQDMRESFGRRIGQLSPRALRLARMLALYRGALSLGELFCLVPDATDGQAMAALDQLLVRDVVVNHDESYRFGNELMRDAVLTGLDARTTEELYAELGRALITLRPDVFQALRAGEAHSLATPDLCMALNVAWYLMRGGETLEARDLMRDAAIALSVRGEGLSEAIPALEAALQVYRASGARDADTTPLVVPLTLAGNYGDYKLAYRYGSDQLSVLTRLTGIAFAQRARRFLGARLALWVGLASAAIRYRLVEQRRMRHEFRFAVLGVIGLGSALMGAATVLEDRELARSIAERLAPLAAFPRRHPARTVFRFIRAMATYTLGDHATAREETRAALAQLREPGGGGNMPAEARAQVEVGMLSLLGPIDVFRTDGSAHTVLEALEQMSAHFVSRQVAESVRTAYHGHRGERVRALEHHERLDVLAAQAGSTWRHDVGLPRLLWSTYALCEDVMGLKRAMRTLETWAEDAPSLTRVRDVVRACYLSERGLHAEALERYTPLFEATLAEHTLYGARVAGAYARVLRLAGRCERAIDVCTGMLARLGPRELAFTLSTLALRIERPLARSTMGDHAQAARELDQLIDEHTAHDNPLVRGLIHRARARVAMDAGDPAVFEAQLGATEQWFRRTQNPALAAQVQALVEEARARGLLRGTPRSRRPANDQAELPQVAMAFEACRGPGERFQAAIDLVLAATGGERGYLYLMHAEGLRFVAPNVGVEPPEALRLELAQRLVNLDGGLTEAENRDFRTETLMAEEDGELTQANVGGQSYRSLLLTLTRAEGRVAVGAIALVDGDGPTGDAPLSFLEEVARGIYGAGDVHTVFIQPAEQRGLAQRG